LIRLFNEQAASAPRFVLVTERTPVLETEPNDDFKKPQALEDLPISIDGRLDKSGDVDSFRVSLQAGQTLIASVDAYTLGSPVDAVLRLVDSRGVQLALNHDDGRTLDPQLAWTAPTSGDYIVRFSASLIRQRRREVNRWKRLRLSCTSRSAYLQYTCQESNAAQTAVSSDGIWLSLGSNSVRWDRIGASFQTTVLRVPDTSRVNAACGAGGMGRAR
jgi:hypothetical protein